MGGNAVKNCERMTAEQYYSARKEVVSCLQGLFPDRKLAIPKSYRNKSSFGDIDIVFEGNMSYLDAMAIVKEFDLSLESDCSQQLVEGYPPKGSSFSFRYKTEYGQAHQVDLLFVPSECFYSAYYYYSYNDVTNLLGTITKGLGFKLGWQGASVIAYGYGRKKELVFTRDFFAVLALLGLSEERYKEGFDDIEDMYRYVASSPYFNRALFDDANQNSTSLVRNRKRTVYIGFQKWLESQAFLTERPYEILDLRNGYASKDESFYTNVLTRIFPEVADWEERLKKGYELDRKFKKLFNGSLVQEQTGLSGVELGEFMKAREHRIDDSFKEKVVLQYRMDWDYYL